MKSPLLLSLAAFLLAAPAAFAVERIPESLASSYRFDAETMPLTFDDTLAVVSEALRFYFPPKTQVRWLENLMLPEQPTTPAVAMGPRMIEALISRLGTRYRHWHGERDDREGMRLRFSGPYASSPESARVVVETQYLAAHETRPPSRDVFLLTRNKNGSWRISAMGKAEAETAWD